MRLPAVILLAALAAGGLSGCTTTPATRPAPEPVVGHGAPILLNVRVAEIDSRYRPVIAPPNIERSVSPTPEAALIKWAQQRLRSDGAENVARFTILDAPLTAQNLPTQGGIAGAFTTEPSQRWTVTLEAQLEILDETGARLDGYTAKVSRTRDLPEGQSPEQRSRFWAELLTAAMAEFDGQMESGVRQYALRWLH